MKAEGVEAPYDNLSGVTTAPGPPAAQGLHRLCPVAQPRRLSTFGKVERIKDWVKRGTKSS